MTIDPSGPECTTLGSQAEIATHGVICDKPDKQFGERDMIVENRDAFQITVKIEVKTKRVDDQSGNSKADRPANGR